EEIKEAIKHIIALVFQECPKTRVLLVGIFPRGADPADPDRAKIMDANAQTARLDDGGSIRFLDIGDRFLDPEGNLKGMMPDHLHPSPEGYRSWADVLGPHLRAMLQES